ncbi:putative reverse transcriptase domain-containing protein [Tanacetum coccineum]
MILNSSRNNSTTTFGNWCLGWIFAQAEIPDETPVIPHVAPEVKAIRVTSPARVLDLITYSSTDFDSSEDPPAPVNSPFFHSFETSRVFATNGSLERPPSQDPYKVIVSRWRSIVVARSSPPSSPTHDLPPAIRQIVPAPLDVPRRHAILVLPGQAIPFGRPYRTQPNGVRKMLIARKRVQELPSARLASRYPPDHSSSDHFSSIDSSSDSSSDYSSNSSSGHSLPDSSFSYDESCFDALATTSVGPSRKRCRSLATSVPLATPALGALSHVRADLLPPRKRIRGFAITSDYDHKTATTLKVGIGIEADVGVKVGIGIEREDEVEEQRRRTLVASEEKAGMLDSIEVLERDNMRLRGMLCVVRERIDSLRRHISTMPTTTRFGMTPTAIEEMIKRHVAEALEAYKANRNHGPIMESGDEHEHDNENANGNGNGDRGNGNGNPNWNVRGVVPITRECTYQDSMKCQPLKFKGTEGVVGLTRWFEKMETCNSHKRTIGTDDAYAMSWKALIKLMTEGNVIVAEPIRLQDAIRIANHLMDPKLKGYSAKNAKKQEENVGRAYTVRNNEKRGFTGPLPYCNKCKLHHEGRCTMKCTNYKKVGHMARDCRATVAATAQRALMNLGNKAANNDARGRAYTLGGGDGNPYSNVVTDVSYTIELADERIAESHTIIRGCTLNLLDHPFNIDLMPIDLGSFNVIIRMDWLSRYHAVIIYDEKIVRIPYGNEILTIRGGGRNNRSNSRLNIISCTKTQKYIHKGCHVFLAQVSVKKMEDKSEEE